MAVSKLPVRERWSGARRSVIPNITNRAFDSPFRESHYDSNAGRYPLANKVAYGYVEAMNNPSQEDNAWKKTFKENDWLLEVIVSGLALLVTSILPLITELNERTKNVVDTVRWSAMAIALWSVIRLFKTFHALQIQNKESEHAVRSDIAATHEKLDRALEHLERERLIELPSAELYLSTLRGVMRNAKRRVLLMYFVESPPSDDSTEEYWRAFVDLLIEKSSKDLEFKRIATIASPAKLQALLANHVLLFDVCKERGIDCRKIKYRLVYYPFPEIKPPQADIVDDSLFLFSPYSGGASLDRVWTRNQTLVENFARYYDGLWGFMQARGHLIFDCCNRDRPRYEEREVIAFMEIARTLKMDERKTFNRFIEKYSPIAFARVQELLNARTN
ncbi:MAG TPA: hypothetical protein VEH04_17520 [Verrucomicrobiae bacterium]|nr:hypothetical protein [Verrucomicrobiae bacterium]